MFLNLAEDSIGEINDPVDRMVIGHTGEYLNSVVQLFFGLLHLVDHHQELRVVAITDGIHYIVLAHLLFSQSDCLLEGLEEILLAQRCTDLALLFVYRGQEIM